MPPGGPSAAVVSGAVAKATTVPAGACTFTPNANEHGIDSPAVTLTDGAVQISRTLTLDVIAVNDAPMAVADSCATAFNTALTIAAAGVPGNDSDPDGDALTAILATDVADGTLVLNANGASPIRHVRASDGTALIDENFTIGVIDIEPEGWDPFLGFTFGTGAIGRGTEQAPPRPGIRSSCSASAPARR